MRRSRSAPGRGSAPASAAISRTVKPGLGLKKYGALMQLLTVAPLTINPWRRRRISERSRSERRPAAEPEHLFLVESLLCQWECEVESDRPEWRGPQDAGTDRAVDEHVVV